MKYILGKKEQRIFASTYQFHLPTVEELETELKKEVHLIKQELKSGEKE